MTAPFAHLDRRGVVLGVGAYATWGLFPAFWPLLDPAAPIEVLAHRILWTLVLMAVVPWWRSRTSHSRRPGGRWGSTSG